AVYLAHGERKKPGTSPHAARDLTALLQITHALHDSTELDAIFRSLLDASFDIAPFDRGAVLLIGPSQDLTASYTASRDGDPDPTKVNPETIEKVVEERVALVDAGPRSSMTVPLCCFDRAIGVLYLETGSPAAAAQLDHWLLQLFMAIGAIAGQAIENGRR